MNDRSLLERAHAHIQQKDYRAARQILLEIPNNPTAIKWLAKLDTLIERPVAKPQSGQSSTFTPKVRKPLPDVPDIDLDSLAPKKPSTQNGTGSKPNLLSIGYATVIIAGALLLGFALASDFLSDLFGGLGPGQTFQNDRILVSSAAAWETNPLQDHGWCHGEGLECLHFIKTRPNVGLLFTYVPLSDYFSSTYFAQFNWDDSVGDPVFVKRERVTQDVTIGGLSGVAQMYYQSENDENGGEFYMLDVYVADGLDGYVINAYANTPCNLSRKMAEVNAVLSTLRFTSTNTPVLEDGYTPASPVAITISAC